MEHTQCPVCRFAQVPSDAQTCPQCDADLTCFKALAALGTTSAGRGHEAAPMDHPQAATPLTNGLMDRQRLPLLFAFTVIVGLFGLLTWRMFAFERLAYEMLERLDSRRVVAPVTASATHGVDCSAQQSATSADAVLLSTYHVRPGDTLWHIARRLYGSGRYYRLMLAQNPHVHPDRLAVGEPLRFVSDLPRALQLYGEMKLHAAREDDRTNRPRGRRNAAFLRDAPYTLSAARNGTHTQ